MEFVPWKTFARIIDRHKGDVGVRTLGCADLFRIMAFSQLTWRESLRDIEVCLQANQAKLFHMGIATPPARSTLADALNLRDWRIYHALALRLISHASEHGDFPQTPWNHLQGQGCPKCGQVNCHDKQRFGIKEFIEKANIVHAGKFDYAKTIYIGIFAKVIITCKEHGDFLQTPNMHLRGNGCPECAHNFPVPFHEFVKRSREAHGEAYTYTESGYSSTQEKATIVCPKHGQFQQLPSDHWAGRGCRKCSGTAPLALEEFIQRATEVHGGKYNYAKTVYE
jgi:Zn finger protein HypA/HybF involved in hydrogenase expression